MKKTIFSLTFLLFMVYIVHGQVGMDEYEKEMRVTASFYCHGSKNCKVKSKGITAIGDRVKEGIIAVDPKVIPLRRVVEIVEPQNIAGVYYSSDTGGKIKGKRIDIWNPSQKNSMRLGMIKNVVLRVYPKGYTLKDKENSQKEKEKEKKKMFLKDDQSFEAFQLLVDSLEELKIFYREISSSLDLGADPTLWEVHSKIRASIEDNVKLRASIDALKGIEKKLAYLSGEQEALNIEKNVYKQAFHEILQLISVILKARDLPEYRTSDAEYIAYMLSCLRAIVTSGIAKNSTSSISELVKKVDNLKHELSSTIENYYRLKHKISNLFYGDDVLSIDDFNSKLEKFISTDFIKMKENSDKFDLLVKTGSILDVNNKIYSNKSFHVTYETK